MGMVTNVFALFVIIFFVCILICIDGLKRVSWFLLPAWKTPLLKNYKPQNGDILMVHYVGHGLHGVPVAESYPTHAAFVYVDKKGKAFAIEATRFAAPEQANVLQKTQHRLAGVRMVPLAHYINHIDSVIYLRQVDEASVQISADQVEAALEWASKIDFETRILDTMTYDVTVAIGCRLIWPEISKWCLHASKLEDHERRLPQAFCSEFVSRLFQKLGVFKKDFKDHFMMSPASFLHTAFARNVEPNLESLANEGFLWKPDQMLVRAK